MTDQETSIIKKLETLITVVESIHMEIICFSLTPTSYQQLKCECNKLMEIYISDIREFRGIPIEVTDEHPDSVLISEKKYH